MKTILLSTLLLFSSSALFSQTTIYSNDFTAGGGDFTLAQGNNFDTWIVNNVYTCSTNTPNQGGGNYMHIYDDLGGDLCAYCGFYGSGSSGTVYSTKKTNIITTGYSSITLTFDWLCKGQTGNILPSYGFIDYSTDAGTSWTNITQPFAFYYGQGTWTGVTITSTQVPAFLNQTSLRFRFGFQNSGYGTNPAFAVDNIKVVGNGSTSINENSDIELQSVFPNPFSGSTTIELGGFQPNISTVLKVYDITGREVKQMKVISKSTVLEKGELQPGIYFLCVDTNGKHSAMKKIVVE